MAPLALAVKFAPEIGSALLSIIVPTMIESLTRGQPTPEDQAKVKGLIEREAARRSQLTGLGMAEAMQQVNAELKPMLEKGIEQTPGLMESLLTWGAGGIAGGIGGHKLGGKIAGKFKAKAGADGLSAGGGVRKTLDQASQDLAGKSAMPKPDLGGAGVRAPAEAPSIPRLGMSPEIGRGRNVGPSQGGAPIRQDYEALLGLPAPRPNDVAIQAPDRSWIPGAKGQLRKAGMLPDDPAADARLVQATVRSEPFADVDEILAGRHSRVVTGRGSAPAPAPAAAAAKPVGKTRKPKSEAEIPVDPADEALAAMTKDADEIAGMFNKPPAVAAGGTPLLKPTDMVPGFGRTVADVQSEINGILGRIKPVSARDRALAAQAAEAEAGRAAFAARLRGLGAVS